MNQSVDLRGLMAKRHPVSGHAVPVERLVSCNLVRSGAEAGHQCIRYPEDSWPWQLSHRMAVAASASTSDGAPGSGST